MKKFLQMFWPSKPDSDSISHRWGVSSTSAQNMLGAAYFSCRFDETGDCLRQLILANSSLPELTDLGIKGLADYSVLFCQLLLTSTRVKDDAELKQEVEKSLEINRGRPFSQVAAAGAHKVK